MASAASDPSRRLSLAALGATSAPLGGSEDGRVLFSIDPSPGLLQLCGAQVLTATLPHTPSSFPSFALTLSFTRATSGSTWTGDYTTEEDVFLFCLPDINFKI